MNAGQSPHLVGRARVSNNVLTADKEAGRAGEPPRAGGPTSRSSVQDPKLGCPFFKRDPLRHSKHRSCTGPGWTTVHRVKYALSASSSVQASRSHNAKGAYIPTARVGNMLPSLRDYFCPRRRPCSPFSSAPSMQCPRLPDPRRLQQGTRTAAETKTKTSGHRRGQVEGNVQGSVPRRE